MGPGERVQNGLSRDERECVCARTEEAGEGQAELEGAWMAPGLKAPRPPASDYAGRLSQPQKELPSSCFLCPLKSLSCSAFPSFCLNLGDSAL